MIRHSARAGTSLALAGLFSASVAWGEPAPVAFAAPPGAAGSASFAVPPGAAGSASLDGPPTARAPSLRAMSIADALAYARAHQPAIRAALARVESQTAVARVPSSQWLPHLTVTAQLFGMTANNTTGTYVQPDFLDVPRIGGTRSTATGTFAPYASTFVGGGVTQEVFDFGRIEAQRAAADAEVNVAQHGADAARLDVDFGVEEAFYSVLAAKGVMRVANEAYGRSLVHRDLAKRGVDSGLRSPIELTRAEADLARYDVGRMRALGGVSLAQSVLAASIGAPDTAVDADEQPPGPADLPTLAEAVSLAQSRDPHLAATLAELEASERRTRAIGAELRPDISGTATLSGRAGGAPPSNSAVPTGDGWLPIVPNWDAGLVFTWPLFDGVVVARRDASAAEERQHRDELDVDRLRIVARVHETYDQVLLARSAVLSLRNAVVAARANWDQADARFRAGIGNAVELADAEAVRADAEIQLALGQFELERARAAFGRAISEGL